MSHFDDDDDVSLTGQQTSSAIGVESEVNSISQTTKKEKLLVMLRVFGSTA